MPPRSTSFRLSDPARRRLAERAQAEGISATSLLERLIVEGIDALEHPGIIHRGPPHDRRAALSAGPDVWEVVARLGELPGAEEERIRLLAEETELRPPDIRLALEYASHHPADVQDRIEQREQAIQRSRTAAEQRASFLR